MAYTNFEYYINVFKGSIINDSTAFDSLSEKATDYINTVTFDRVSEVNDKIKRCCCALSEEMYKGHLSQGGKLVSSESNGKYSITYSQALEVQLTPIRLKSICLRYLDGTGLMYRGV